ncbi:hypothetical protein [Brachybacterium subflavum]|uniref:hypothetical protein n=1 Tax=Brachybacterium subflavum TaxID=2585206 RepID=UPI001D0D56E3|nr:hypothetical protein [Brachybacterium subflavum]
MTPMHDLSSAPVEWISRTVSAGGVRVAARNPYWDTWGVTLRDPDGYLLVLCRRDWDTPERTGER